MDVEEKRAFEEDEEFIKSVGGEDGYTHVFPWLILCGVKDLPLIFERESVTHHLNCASELLKGLEKVVPSHVTFKNLPISYKCRHPLEQLPQFKEASQFIAQCQLSNGVCVVNCARGHSRSASVVLFFCLEVRAVNDSMIVEN